MPWDPRASHFDEIDGLYIYLRSLFESQTTDEVTITISMEMPVETVFERVLGCLLIGMMPDQGLEEALYSLRDMLQFYREEPALPITQLESETFNVTLVDSKKRPNLIITE